jgi:hypothetical protein
MAERTKGELTMAKQKISHVTPGLYEVGDRVRPVSRAALAVLGYGQIVAIHEKGNPYEIKFAKAFTNLSYREDEIQK